MLNQPKQKQKKQLYGVEYKHVYSLRIVYLVITGLLLLLLSFMIYFIYKNVFQALDEANVIVILQSDLQMKTINFEQLKEADNSWQLKHAPKSSANIYNPFFLSNDSVPVIELNTSSTSTPETAAPSQGDPTQNL